MSDEIVVLEFAAAPPEGPDFEWCCRVLHDRLFIQVEKVGGTRTAPVEWRTYDADAAPGMLVEAHLEAGEAGYRGHGDGVLEADVLNAPMPKGPGCGLEVPFGYRQVEKAWSMLHGKGATAKGPQVEAYERNLAGDLSVVTVDRHVTLIATAGAAKQVSLSQVKAIKVALKSMAAMRGIEPAVVQAAMWMRRDERRNRALAATPPCI